MDEIFKALSDINRRKIITILRNKSLGVNELLKYFKIKQATLSNHLAILKKAKLVNSEVKGKNRIYNLNYPVLREFVIKINNFMESGDIAEIKVREIRK